MKDQQKTNSKATWSRWTQAIDNWDRRIGGFMKEEVKCYMYWQRKFECKSNVWQENWEN